MLNANNASIYTDFKGLAKLKQEARNNSPEAIKEVASQFESIFLSRVLKSMRQAKLADGILDSDKSDFYRDMYDQQLALHLAGKPGIGLADLIARQLSPQSSNTQNKLGLVDYFKQPVKQHVNSAKPVERQFEVKPLPPENVTKPKTIQHRFAEKLMPLAQQAADELGVKPGVLIAQAALETGWGKSIITHENGRNSFNLFNIKAGKSWQGDHVNKKTLEFDQGVAHKLKADFRSYDSYQDSFTDYVRLLKNNPRYKHALQQAHHPQRYMQALQQAGYATDPDYAKKVMKIYRSDAISHASPIVSAQTGEQGVSL